MKKRKKCSRGDSYESPRPAREGQPTDSIPGSEAKIAILTERAARRESLHVCGDVTGIAGLLVRLIQRKNGSYVRDLDHPDGEVLDFRTEHEKKSPTMLHKLNGANPGDRLQQARQRAGLSGRSAAVAMGLSPTALSRIEKRIDAPSLWVIYHAARIYSVCPDWLACTDSSRTG